MQIDPIIPWGAILISASIGAAGGAFVMAVIQRRSQRLTNPPEQQNVELRLDQLENQVLANEEQIGQLREEKAFLEKLLSERSSSIRRLHND